MRPSTGSIEVPQPLDDRTQNANASGEYAGTTPWGTRWNTSLKYSGSFYSNENKSIDVDNPFCRTCSAVGPSPFGASLLRYGLYPDNNVNGATWSTAVEIPLFKTRYVSNVQYMAFRQNDPFLNDATNGLTFGLGAGQIRPYPGEPERRSERLPHQQRAVFAADQRSDQYGQGPLLRSPGQHAGIGSD